MDNMRKHAVSPRKSISRLNVAAGRKRLSRNGSSYATYELLKVNGEAVEIVAPGVGEALGSSALIREVIGSAVRHSHSLSLDTVLRQPMVSRIIETCRSISGDKILTVCRDHDAAFTIRLRGDGTIVGGPSSTQKLRSELTLALQHGGTLVIRQQLSIMTRQAVSDGVKRWAPWKQVYAFNLGNDRFEAVPVEELQYANSTGPDSPPATREQRLIFREYRMPADSTLH